MLAALMLVVVAFTIAAGAYLHSVRAIRAVEKRVRTEFHRSVARLESQRGGQESANEMQDQLDYCVDEVSVLKARIRKLEEQLRSSENSDDWRGLEAGQLRMSAPRGQDLRSPLAPARHVECSSEASPIDPQTAQREEQRRRESEFRQYVAREDDTRPPTSDWLFFTVAKVEFGVEGNSLCLVSTTSPRKLTGFPWYGEWKLLPMPWIQMSDEVRQLFPSCKERWWDSGDLPTAVSAREVVSERDSDGSLRLEVDLSGGGT